jgi:predicted Zn finger-like uncharacterized protein
MSLATRCPVCSTVFRVVQDQLKVSEGWVRCGRCAKVFNAFEGLFDLERELAAMAPPSVTPAQRVLQDLAERNRNPKPRGDWPGDDFDTGGSFRGSGHAPLSGASPPTEPAAMRTAPAAFSPSTNRAALSPPPTTAPANPWTTSRPAPWGAAPKPTARAPGTVSRPAPLSEPSPAWSQSRPAPMSPAAVAPAATPATPIAATPPASVPASVPAPQATTAGIAPAPPAPSGAAFPTAAAAPAQIDPPTPAVEAPVALRADPAPMNAEPADAGPSSGSYESLFRSTGELDSPTAHPSAIDIVLDGQDSGSSDAVDSRLLSFVQQADKAARWQQPRVRAGLAGAAAVLGLTLVVQLGIGARDSIAARWPAARPLLEALCAPLDCRIEAPRRIDRLAVESSGLTRMAEGPVYRLAMVLRNRGDTPLMLPAVDLSLTDSGGALVSRRILSAAELGAPRATIAPGQEMPLQALLMSADRPLTGYTIEIFYP